MNRNTSLVFVAWMLGGVFWPIEPANAYVDPGSGSVIITTILGIFAAIGFTLRKYFYRVRRLVRKEATTEKAGTDS